MVDLMLCTDDPITMERTTTGFRWSQLPEEIALQCFEALYWSDYFGSLTTTMLVCRSWRNFCSKVIYKDCALNFWTISDRSEGRWPFQRRNAPLLRGLDPFSNRHIAANVRSLTLGLNMSIWPCDTAPVAIRNSFFDISRLNRLRFLSVHISLHWDDFNCLFDGSLPRLEGLEIDIPSPLRSTQQVVFDEICAKIARIIPGLRHFRLRHPFIPASIVPTEVAEKLETMILQQTGDRWRESDDEQSYHIASHLRQLCKAGHFKKISEMLVLSRVTQNHVLSDGDHIWSALVERDIVRNTTTSSPFHFCSSCYKVWIRTPQNTRLSLAGELSVLHSPKVWLDLTFENPWSLSGGGPSDSYLVRRVTEATEGSGRWLGTSRAHRLPWAFAMSSQAADHAYQWDYGQKSSQPKMESWSETSKISTLLRFEALAQRKLLLPIIESGMVQAELIPRIQPQEELDGSWAEDDM